MVSLRTQNGNVENPFSQNLFVFDFDSRIFGESDIAFGIEPTSTDDVLSYEY